MKCNLFITLFILFIGLFISNATEIVKISAGVEHNLVLLDDGTVWTWGNNCCGQLGNGTTDSSNVPIQVHGVDNIGYLDNIIDISAGFYYSLARSVDGSVFAWGNNDYGQLGDGNVIQRNIPVQVLDSAGIGFLANIIEISAGALHCAAIRNDSTIFVWGGNRGGELGIGTSDTLSHSFPIHTLDIDSSGLLTGIVKISAGSEYNLALRYDGTVLSWGANSDGQLGNDTTLCRYLPDFVLGSIGDDTLRDVIAISACPLGVLFTYGHSFVIETDSTVWSFGRNDNGQLGINSTTPAKTPVQVMGQYGIGFLENVIAIDEGREFSVALKSDGTVWAWGNNYFGQLGDGTTNDRLTPVQVHGEYDIGFLTDIVAISASQHHNLALRVDGTLFAWGRNNCGQLGDGTFIDRHYPVQVIPIPLGIENYYYNIPQDISVEVYPNPFNSSCRIIAPENAEIEIYDLRGNIVGSRRASTDIAADIKTSDASVAHTNRTFVWTPDKSISSGIYLVRVFLGKQTIVKRVVFLK
ncbi:T9SS type A sorting domain-containing protein [bacterium]|nr:T9SS type A sorting domain-containing protein [bacterium]